MAKKQSRTDAERRVRQCERLGRLLRLLHLIMGKGRWDAATLAEELECSRRTVYRLLQSLSMAGVPWHFDETCRAYRVRPGYKFSGLEPIGDRLGNDEPITPKLDPLVEQLISDGEAFTETLNRFLATLRQRRNSK